MLMLLVVLVRTRLLITLRGVLSRQLVRRITTRQLCFGQTLCRCRSVTAPVLSRLRIVGVFHILLGRVYAVSAVVCPEAAIVVDGEVLVCMLAWQYGRICWCNPTAIFKPQYCVPDQLTATS